MVLNRRIFLWIFSCFLVDLIGIYGDKQIIPEIRMNADEENCDFFGGIFDVSLSWFSRILYYTALKCNSYFWIMKYMNSYIFARICLNVNIWSNVPHINQIDLIICVFGLKSLPVLNAMDCFKNCKSLWNRRNLNLQINFFLTISYSFMFYLLILIYLCHLLMC